MSPPSPAHAVDVRRIPAGGQTVVIVATPAERDALAERLAVPAVREARARLAFMPGPKGTVAVAGEVEAVVTRTCVRSLEAFDQAIREDVAMTFSPDPAVALGRDEDGDADAPDLLEGDTIDAFAVAAEFMALGLDPYPVKPGAELPPHETGEAALNPFAALGKLKES